MQTRAQLTDIQRALAALNSGDPLQPRLAAAATQTAAAASQLSRLIDAPASTLRAADLAALEDVVHSSETSTLLTQAAESAVRVQAVVTTAAATHQEVQTLAHDVFDKRIFDPWLHFASPEDAEAYRQREAEARKYIEAQLAHGTPEGDLNAGGGMLGQMLDAHAHGAGDSPDFLPRWNALVEKTQRQHAAMRADGQSTEEFDRNLTTSVRRFLKAKGLSDAEIDKRLAASADPLDAVKPFIKNDRDSRSLEGKMERVAPPAASSQSLPRVEADTGPPTSDAPLTIDIDAMNARLKAAGVLLTDTADAAGHGLAVQKPAAKTALRVGD